MLQSPSTYLVDLARKDLLANRERLEMPFKRQNRRFRHTRVERIRWETEAERLTRSVQTFHGKFTRNRDNPPVDHKHVTAFPSDTCAYVARAGHIHDDRTGLQVFGVNERVGAAGCNKEYIRAQQDT